jgi:hypothetical protein
LSAWLRVARPLAQPLFFAPLAFGQALALASTGRASWRLFAWALVLGLLVHALVFFGRAASQGAGQRAVAITFGSLLLLAAIGAHLAFGERRPFMLALLMLAPMLLWMDSFPPLALRRRGRAHWSQAIVLGLLLPIAGFYLQSGELISLGASALSASFVLGVGGGLAVRERSDRRDRIAAITLISLAALASPLVVPDAPLAAWVATIAVTAVLVILSLRSWMACSAAAVAVQLGWASAALASVPPS